MKEKRYMRNPYNVGVCSFPKKKLYQPHGTQENFQWNQEQIVLKRQSDKANVIFTRVTYDLIKNVERSTQRQEGN